MNNPMPRAPEQFTIRSVIRIISRFRHQLANISWLFAGKIIRMALALVAGICVARYLGAEYFGILSYATAFALMARPLAVFQLEGICVRELVRAPEKRGEILGSAFALSLGAGILSFALATGLIFTLRPEDPLTCLMVAIVGTGLIFLPFEVFDYYFQARVNSRPVVLARTLVLGLISLVKILGIMTRPSLPFFAVMTLAESVFVGLALWWTYHRHTSRIKLTPDPARIKQLFADAWPLALSGMAAAVYLRIDKIMLGEMMGNQAVGLYTAATRLAEAWYFLPVCIMTSLYPVVVGSLDKDTGTGKGMQRIYHLMAVTGAATGLVTSLTATPVVLALFGPEFVPSGQILAWYAWSGLFVGMAMAKAAWLKAMNYTKIQFASTLAGAVINIGLNLMLIPKYGPMGAVWATLVSYAVEAWLILFFFKATRPQAVMIFRALVFWNISRTLSDVVKQR